MSTKPRTVHVQNDDDDTGEAMDKFSIHVMAYDTFTARRYHQLFVELQDAADFTLLCHEPYDDSYTILDNIGENDPPDYGSDFQLIFSQDLPSHIEKSYEQLPPSPVRFHFVNNTEHIARHEKLFCSPQLFSIQENNHHLQGLAVKGILHTIFYPGLICVDFADVRTVFSGGGPFLWWAIQENEFNEPAMNTIMEQSQTAFDKPIASAMLVIPFRPGFGIQEYSLYGDILESGLQDNCTVVVASPYDSDLDGNVVLYLGT